MDQVWSEMAPIRDGCESAHELNFIMNFDHEVIFGTEKPP